AHDATIELQVETVLVLQQAQKDARELRLLALDAIGMSGCVRKSAEVELRQYPVLLAAVLKARSSKSLRNERLRRSEPIEHVEGRRMKGGSAGLFAEIRTSLEHGHRHAMPQQIRGGDETDRARACDEHPILAGHEWVLCSRSHAFELGRTLGMKGLDPFTE